MRVSGRGHESMAGRPVGCNERLDKNAVASLGLRHRARRYAGCFTRSMRQSGRRMRLQRRGDHRCG